ncbi:AI-2E family transporter [Clostridium ihumii]|uniref:AI-2E family transporter n=1 Tax=Clostridium ihumii TaxID=1470356 RepID=UPI003D343CE6
MKIDWNRKYTTVAVYSFIVICLSVVFYLIASDLTVFTTELDNIMATFQPFIIGFAIAYLLNSILKFYEDKILSKKAFEKMKPKSKRGVGVLFTYITLFVILFLFFNFVFPQLVESIVGLANDIPHYVKNLSEMSDQLMSKLNLNEEYFKLALEKWNEFVNYIIQFLTDLIPILGNMLKNVASRVWNIVLGIIVSAYLLIDKEKFFGLCKKITYALFSEKATKRILELTHRSNKTFEKFISGKILDSLIIGILTFIVLTIFKMPYTLLVSVIIGITNIIPFFGPFFGAIPSFVIILFVSPIKALWFLLIILIIQQIDGNIIGPKILGDSIGVSAFWILFALLVTGKFLGLLGMIIGVPLFAIIYSIIKDIIEDKLKKKGLPEETSDYM